MAEQTDAERLAAANDTILATVENGPWVLISDPQLRQIVSEYVADTCHAVASAAGLDEAMERAHDAMPQRLARSLPGQRVAPEARERLARHLWIADGKDPDLWERLQIAGRIANHYGTGGDTVRELVAANGQDACYARADELLTVITAAG